MTADLMTALNIALWVSAGASIVSVLVLVLFVDTLLAIQSATVGLPIVIVLLLAGCSAGNVRPLAYTSVDDPVWRINPETTTGNRITDPPAMPAGRLPAN